MPDGRARTIEPGEPGYRNIFGSSAEDYSNAIDNIINSINSNKAYYNNADFLLSILQDFKTNIQNSDDL